MTNPEKTQTPGPNEEKTQTPGPGEGKAQTPEPEEESFSKADVTAMIKKNVDSALGRAKAAHEKELASLKAKLEEYDSKGLSELEKLRKSDADAKAAYAKLQQEKDALSKQLLRTTIAQRAKLDEDLLPAMVGETEEELTASAVALVLKYGTRPQAPPSAGINPPQQGGKRVWKRSEITKMTPEERMAQVQELSDAEKEGRIKYDE
jgi:hypothetical protein